METTLLEITPLGTWLFIGLALAGLCLIILVIKKM